jgi:hypothetical protein
MRIAPHAQRVGHMPEVQVTGGRRRKTGQPLIAALAVIA